MYGLGLQFSAVGCSTLDKIKCNLRKEQRTVMELNFVTMHRILSPLQVGPRSLPQSLWSNVAGNAPLLLSGWLCTADTSGIKV